MTPLREAAMLLADGPYFVRVRESRAAIKAGRHAYEVHIKGEGEKRGRAFCSILSPPSGAIVDTPRVYLNDGLFPNLKFAPYDWSAS